ncbi:hypothetical protein GYMLUDRAFT_239033 [Collybiopsis luxurians FD-317 M1]|nr:hypothetical protein GYMLUDRAFT_239033 [Collybiopsis luxurians FD-317 M1]
MASAKLAYSRPSVGSVRVKRPLNSFFIFRSELFYQLQRQDPKPIRGNFSTIASDKWKSLSDEEKMVYEVAAERAKMVHQARYPGYRYQPRKHDANSTKKPRKRLKVKEISQHAGSPLGAQAHPPSGFLALTFFPFDDCAARPQLTLTHKIPAFPPNAVQAEPKSANSVPEIPREGAFAEENMLSSAPFVFNSFSPRLEDQRTAASIEAFVESDSHPHSSPAEVDSRSIYEGVYRSSSLNNLRARSITFGELEEVYPNHNQSTNFVNFEPTYRDAGVFVNQQDQNAAWVGDAHHRQPSLHIHSPSPDPAIWNGCHGDPDILCHNLHPTGVGHIHVARTPIMASSDNTLVQHASSTSTNEQLDYNITWENGYSSQAYSQASTTLTNTFPHHGIYPAVRYIDRYYAAV